MCTSPSTEIENALPHRLDFEWKTDNNTMDCGVVVIRYMEMWFGITTRSGIVTSHLIIRPRRCA
ncbi:hypothetical protein Hanom_Chr07g00638231 [Helianthus anomalus]